LPQNPVLTIGHSTHEVGAFCSLLTKHQVTAVADVRSTPYSRFQPQFNRETIARTLKRYGIDYVFLGMELGARSDDPAMYDGGRVQYRRLASNPIFQEGLSRIRKGAEDRKIVLMCAEREPLECHRTLLIARELVAVGIDVSHIHPDQCLESHHDALERLRKRLKLPEKDLFRSPSDIIEEAYAKQEARIAFVVEELAQDGLEDSE
jgi:uncharacterized protein (DUF488 family)